MIDKSVMYTNNQGFHAVILSEDESLTQKHGSKYVKIMFLETRNVRSVGLSALRSGSFKNYGAPTVYGVGYSFAGAYKNHKRLYNIWKDMLKRCYVPYCKDYPHYGGRGVIVSAEWLHFKYFLRDVATLDNYDHFLQNRSFTLDKDFRRTNGLLYSKETSRFSSKIEQANAKRNTRPVEAVEMVSGEVISLPSLAECSRQTGISKSRICTSIKRAQNCGNYRFSYIKTNPESVENTHIFPNTTAANHTHT